MKKLNLSVILLLSASQVFGECIPARTEVAYPDDAPRPGRYHRVSADGNSVIMSQMYGSGNSANVGLCSLKDHGADGKIQMKCSKTPLINEAYGCEGRNGWDIMTSPNNPDGMRYYRFDQIQDKGQQAPSLLSDPDHNEWYHSCVELPGSTPSSIKVRTELWGNTYRDITLNFDSKKALTGKSLGPIKTACSNLTRSLPSPILSKDGTEIAAQGPNGTSVIYHLNADSTCTLVEDLGFGTSKVSFGYPEAGKKGKLVFMGSANVMVDGVPRMVNGVFLYDRDKKTTTRLNAGDLSMASYSYPGLTADGRVIYTDSTTRKMVIVDPNQIAPDGKVLANAPHCIQVNAPATGAKPKAKARGATTK